MTPLELINRVDPVTALLVLFWWARWEFWRRKHGQLHVELAKSFPHEVPNA